MDARVGGLEQLSKLPRWRAKQVHQGQFFSLDKFDAAPKNKKRSSCILYGRVYVGYDTNTNACRQRVAYQHIWSLVGRY